MRMSRRELLEHIDHTISCYSTDYDSLYDQTRFYLEQNIPKEQKIDLQWGLTRLHTDTMMLITSLQRLREHINNDYQPFQE